MIRAWIPAMACVAVLGACHEIGNPEVTARRTAPAEWTDGIHRLETQALSVHPSRSNELLRAIAPAEMHHADLVAPSGGVVTLVVVAPTLPPLNPRATLPLLTTFRFGDGEVVERRWQAPLGAARYFAGFGLPDWPTEAVTHIDPR